MSASGSGGASVSQIRVASFKLCRCTLLPNFQLAVGYEMVDLAYGNAVAVSYTGGHYNRAAVVVGHNAQKQLIKMNLGQYWPVQGIIYTLGRIFRKHFRARGCWMDQFCIPQDDPSARRRVVMEIPSIYRTSRTVVVMFGQPCERFKTIAALSIAHQKTGNKNGRRRNENPSGGASCCVLRPVWVLILL